MQLTNDRVVVTTSRGNQEKWFDTEKNLWYKADGGIRQTVAVLRRWLKPFPVKFCAISQMRLGCRESP